MNYLEGKMFHGVKTTSNKSRRFRVAFLKVRRKVMERVGCKEIEREKDR